MFNNYYLRKPCYKCPYKSVHRVSDVTIADGWGVERMFPEWDDNIGISRVLVHTGNGDRIIHAAKNLDLKEVDVQEGLTNVRHIALSSVDDSRRRWFYRLKHIWSLKRSVKIIHTYDMLGQTYERYKGKIRRKISKLFKL